MTIYIIGLLWIRNVDFVFIDNKGFVIFFLLVLVGFFFVFFFLVGVFFGGFLFYKCSYLFKIMLAKL